MYGNIIGLCFVLRFLRLRVSRFSEKLGTFRVCIATYPLCQCTWPQSIAVATMTHEIQVAGNPEYTTIALLRPGGVVRRFSVSNELSVHHRRLLPVPALSLDQPSSSSLVFGLTAAGLVSCRGIAHTKRMSRPLRNLHCWFMPSRLIDAHLHYIENRDRVE